MRFDVLERKVGNHQKSASSRRGKNHVASRCRQYARCRARLAGQTIGKRVPLRRLHLYAPQCSYGRTKREDLKIFLLRAVPNLYDRLGAYPHRMVDLSKGEYATATRLLRAHKRPFVGFPRKSKGRGRQYSI